jgi:signal transduction histidine kinase
MQANWLLAGGAALGVLLVLTAVLQYRWINRVSEADQQQRRSLLETTLRNFQGEFDRTLRDTLHYVRRALGVAPGTNWEAQLNQALAQWPREAAQPHLLSAVSYASLDAAGKSVFKRRPLAASEFTTQEWPAELARYRQMLEQQLRTLKGELPLTPRAYIQEFSAAQPVLIFQLVEDPQPPVELTDDAEPPHHLGRSAERGNVEFLLDGLTPAPANPAQRKAALAGWCFLELDAAYLHTQWLPKQLERHFSQRGLEGYQLALLTGSPPRALYISDAALAPADFVTADAALLLFARRIQSLQEAARPPEPPDPHRQPPPRGPRGGPPPNARRGPPPAFAAFDAAADPTAWRLVVRDAAGSLETAIAQARHRNLALAASVLLILAASIVLLVLATQRVRRLAAQQLEFVAGVSHELRTPLSVIQSTSHNLAQGLVKDPSRVQQYGAAIQTEVRRLSNQIEQMLAFAGIQAGRKLYELRPVGLAESCDRALAEYAGAFEDWQIKCDLPADLPPVLADPQALESALKNLLHNAQKYAAAGRWLHISAKTVAKRQQHEVQLTIADHGPGIAAADLPHIFEPFYRSRSVVATTTPGAGLGLSLVQRHLQAMGGRVTVNTAEGAGTAFTLHLPLAE